MLLLVSVIAASTASAAVEKATAQGMQGHPSMMPGATDQQPKDHGTMQGGMGMCPMMRSGTMQGSMMGSDMMRSGMGALFGSRVTPVMNLSVDDVRGYLASQLEHLNNKRLKVGDINSSDGTISADITTIDNSLVQRLKVDRHTGGITYEN
jgi:hypothetical protein